MSNVNGYQVQAGLPVSARVSLVSSVLAATILPGGAQLVEPASLPRHPCTPQLERLLLEWNAAGFETPSKPTQAIVRGRTGRVSSGPDVTYMADQIRLAIWDCRHGDVPSVRARVALVTKALNQRS
jgi:hypothetical protein